MKRIFILFFLCFSVALNVAATNPIVDLGAKINPDTAVRVGRLQNGLTYYIRHNAEPKERVYFYIAQKVGSIQETDEQKGLAHFLEHMCFNGTENFPDNGLREYLESIGVKFGAELNAYTAIDETVYNIDNVPTTIEGAIDSCLTILKDWSNGLTLDPVEIDKERGVIHEEWRQRNNAAQRLNEAMMPVLMAGSKYDNCMPIGSMDVILNFKPQTLTDYYKTWYRPDLQGVVVVGDIDVDEVEEKIKKIFGEIPAAEPNAPKREYFSVPDNKEPIVFIGADKEEQSIFVQVYYKHDAMPREERNSVEYVKNNLMDNFIGNMFQGRTVEIIQKGNAPFQVASAKNGGYFVAQTKDALRAYVGCYTNNKGIERGFEALLRELQRVKEHGFTQSELEREVENMRTGIESLYREREKVYSARYVDSYVRSFLDNVSMGSVEDECKLYGEILSELTLQDINRRFNSYFKEDGSNVAIAVTMPQNDTLKVPTKEGLLSVMDRVSKEKTTPYMDNVSELPMLPKEPVPGSIVSEGVDSADGLYKMELSNGAKVVIMQTDYKKDQIMMTACSRGGLSLLDTQMYRLGDFLNYHHQVTGLGNWTLLQKNKALAGVNADVSIALNDNYSSISATCSPEYIGSMMEQTHAAFLYPNRDKDAFGALCKRVADSYRDSEGKPEDVYVDSVRVALYGNNPYKTELTPNEIENINYDKIIETLQKAYSDASSFTLFFIGNVNVDTLRPYLEKYIASLPSTYSNPQERSIGEIPPGRRIVEFEKQQEVPSTRIQLVKVAPCEYNLKNYLTAQLLGNVLTMKYTQTIREDAGASYGVGAGAQQYIYPNQSVQCVVAFYTSPDKKDLAMDLVYKGMVEVAEQGPDAVAVEKVKENMLKIDEASREENAYWNNILVNKWLTGVDLSKDYASTLKGITNEDIKEMMERILEGGNEVTVIMNSF